MCRIDCILGLPFAAYEDHVVLHQQPLSVAEVWLNLAA